MEASSWTTRAAEWYSRGVYSLTQQAPASARYAYSPDVYAQLHSHRPIKLARLSVTTVPDRVLYMLLTLRPGA